MDDKSSVFGEVLPDFEEVRREFETNFLRRQEVGAACTVYYKGQKVVDLWGGYRKHGTPWQEETMALMFSATKGLASIALAKLHSDGRLDYDQKMAFYWPEFAQNDKENITVRQLLNHQAGLVLLEDPLHLSDLHDLDKVAYILARTKPLWEPGSHHGYQAGTVGLYMGELVRRIDTRHRSLGRYFREEIVEPLGLDLHIGLPDHISDELVAETKMINPLLALFNLNKMPSGMRRVIINMNSLFMKSATLIKGYDPNKRETWRVEQPSGNGIGTARSVAHLYSLLANGGQELGIDSATFTLLCEAPEQPKEGYLDKVMNIETRYGIGFIKPDPLFNFSPNPQAFGFLGATGSFAFADPNKQIGYAYLTRKMGYYGINDPRDKHVREAVYRCIQRLE